MSIENLDRWEELEDRVRALETRSRDLEHFVTEVKGGQKWVLTALLGISGFVAMVYYVVGIFKEWHHG